MAINDLQARGVILLALAQRGLVVSAAAVQIVQAIARHESDYGVLLGEQHHNWGAIHCVHGPPCRAGCFEAGDKDAAGASYPTCLRSYRSDIEGAADLVRELYRRPHVAAALAAGDVLATGQAMGQPAYGIGAYHQSPPDLYAAAVYRHVQALAAALQEPVEAHWSPPQSPPQSPLSHQSKAAPFWPWLLGAAAAVLWGTRSLNRPPRI